MGFFDLHKILFSLGIVVAVAVFFGSVEHLHDGIERPVAGTLLSIWDPVAVNFTRRIQLEKDGPILTMTTLALDPPIFSMPLVCVSVLMNSY